MKIHETTECADGKQVWIRVDKDDMPMIEAGPYLLEACIDAYSHLHGANLSILQKLTHDKLQSALRKVVLINDSNMDWRRKVL